MRSALRVGAAAALLGLAACAGNGGGEEVQEEQRAAYPGEAVAAFVSECRAQPGASEGACRCVIERLQHTMPYDEYRRADEALRANRDPDEAALEKLERAADACRRP